MSTNPEDRIVGLLSSWLARHLDNAQLRDELEAADRGELSGERAAAVDELLAELSEATATDRGRLEPLVRETIEALALLD
jgi:hypothetical protein